MRHVRATDVEGPGDIVRIGDHQRIGALPRDLGHDLRQLVLGRLAGIAQVMQRHRTERRGGAVLPDRIDRIAFDRDQLGAGLGAGFREPLDALGGVQPGIEAEPEARRQVLFDPGAGRGLDDIDHSEQGGVSLRRRLQRVAPVCEQHRAVGQHDGKAGRASEAGDIGQPFLARGHIFVLVAVGARQHEAVEVTLLQFGAQGGHPRRGVGGVRRLFKGLELG
jgi:hypothetical protein